MDSYPEIRKVLLPTDFSEIAENALHTAISICTKLKAELVVTHVVDEGYYVMVPEATAIPMDHMTIYSEESKKKLAELVHPIKERFDIAISTLLLTGDPAGEICRWSLDNQVDMIIMGTHGASGLREFFIGSNAYRVVKHAPCPVMTIPGSNHWIEFRKVLFPVRLVPDPLSKYEYLRPIIKANGSSLLVAGIAKEGDEANSVLEEVVKSAHRKIVNDDVICSSVIHYTEDIAQTVLGVSDSEKPDLVVITATFESDHPIKHFFVGPYTQQIVNHCKFPVLSIRSEKSVPAGNET